MLVLLTTLACHRFLYLIVPLGLLPDPPAAAARLSAADMALAILKSNSS
jgi:hypothetical protein